MRTLQFAIVFAVTLSLAFTFSPQAFAGVSFCSDPNPTSASGTGTPQPPRFVCNDGGVLTWYIPEDAQFGEPDPGDPNNRVPIDFDPNAGPWVKHLEVDFFDILQGLVVPGQYSDQLREFLVVGPNSPDWTDWHEVIINQPNEEWQFQVVSITTFPPSNVIIQATAPNEVWVDFDPPLQPGTTIDIIKDLVYIGPAPILTPPAFIEVHQYPTVAEERQVVAGETLSIDSSALILLGAQATISWLIPVAVSAVGIGLVIVRKRI